MRPATVRSGWEIKHHHKKREPPGRPRSRPIRTTRCEPLPPAPYPTGFGHCHPLDPPTRPLGSIGVPRHCRFPRIPPPTPVLTIRRFGSLRLPQYQRIGSRCRRSSVLPLTHHMRRPGNNNRFQFALSHRGIEIGITQPLGEGQVRVQLCDTSNGCGIGDGSPQAVRPGGGGRRG